MLKKQFQVFTTNQKEIGESLLIPDLRITLRYFQNLENLQMKIFYQYYFLKVLSLLKKLMIFWK